MVDAEALISDEVRQQVQGDPATGVPKSLRMLVVSKDPKITVIPGFLSDAECQHLLDLVEGCWVPSTVGRKKTDVDAGLTPNLRSRNRTSSSCMVRHAQTAVVERLEHRLAMVAGVPLDQLERPNLVRYCPGEFFGEHHDGKFRPRTVFVYLNDLIDDAGETYFSQIGFKFMPRKGTAVVWSNAQPDGTEDSRMVHEGLPPLKGVKYGVNCFFNDECTRICVPLGRELALEEANVVDVRSLMEDPESADGQPKTVVYVLCKEPRVAVVPQFLTEDEVASLLEMAGDVEVLPQERRTGTDFQREGFRILKHLDYAETPFIEGLEQRLSAVSHLGVERLARLRIIQPGTQPGLSNRGCGAVTAVVCLSEADHIWFPYLGIRLHLRRGDLVTIGNTSVEAGTGIVRDDPRGIRAHLQLTDGPLALNLDAYFHDGEVRQQQRTAHEAPVEE